MSAEGHNGERSPSVNPTKVDHSLNDLAVTGAEPYQPRMPRAEALQAVETNVGQRIRLSEYRSTITVLSEKEREQVIDQAQLMLEQVFVHLPLKRAMHGTEPIQRLRLLKLRHHAINERAFQSEMIDIFTDLRDLHTNYVLPQAYWSKFAFLPFRIEEFYEEQSEEARRFVVTWVSPVNTDRNLTLGVVVTHWNGSPIELAVARHADREAGSNPDARRARGIEALSLRWLGMSLPPDEDWVTLTYTDGTRTHESKFDWEVIDSSDRPALLAGLLDGATRGEAAAALGLDLNTTVLHRARKALFDPQAVQVEAEMGAHRAAAGDAEPPRADTSLFPDVYPRFGEVETPSGRFGYIRLRTFSPEAADEPDADVDRVLSEVVAEFARILALMPPSGLILDVRGNGGGFVNFGERILQMLTPRPITPEPFHFLATPLTYLMAKENGWLGQWQDAIAQAIETGASFSQGFPLSTLESSNDVGQVYQGPVVLVTDALCYSTTDIFAAGFQDHGIGTILGVHNNTGAGGANVWDHAQVLEQLRLPPRNPFVPLPKGAGMRVAVRRSTRVGSRSGAPLEDLGVVPNESHWMTYNDVLDHNADLIAAAAKLLNGKATQTLRLTAGGGAPVRDVAYEANNLDRVDLLVNGRPVLSQDVTTGSGTLALPTPATAGSTLIGNGYRSGELVVSTRLPV